MIFKSSVTQKSLLAKCSHQATKFGVQTLADCLAKFQNKWGVNIPWRDRNETDLEKNERKDDDWFLNASSFKRSP